MAGHTGGHWERRSYVIIVNGKKKLAYKRVWIPDPLQHSGSKKLAHAHHIHSSVPSTTNSARERAQKAAAQALYQRRLATARRAAYETLKKRQLAIAYRAGILREQTKAKQIRESRATPGPGATALLSRHKVGERAAAAAAAESKGLADEQAKKNAIGAQAKWDEYAHQQRKKYVITHAKAGDAKSARNMEKLIHDERLRAVRNGTSDSKYLDALQKKYEEHAQAVYNRYELRVAKLHELLGEHLVGGKWVKYKEPNLKLASKIYRGSDFKRAQREFTRLFGNGSNPLKDGEYSKFYTNLQAISAAQTMWWKRQMKAVLQSKNVSGAHKPGVDEQLKKYAAMAEAARGYVVTGFDPKTGQPTQRKMTEQEALDQQQALLIMERERLGVQYAAHQKNVKALAQFEGMTSMNGQWVDKKDVPIITAAARLKADHPELFPEGGFKSAEQLQGFADKLVEQWEQANPRPPTVGRPGESPAQKVWLLRKQAYEQAVYGFFRSKPPEFYQRVFQLPGVSQATSILQGPVSAIGAGLRVLVGQVTGDTTTLGSSLHWDEAPPGQKYRENQVRKQMIAAGGNPNEPHFEVAYMARIEKMRHDWLLTPEGKDWAAAQKKKNAETSAAEDTDFQNRFYGGQTNALGALAKDPGAWLNALNTYGQQPFENDAANLLFQLLADPTNAIPLKFTTYAARGKYALEAADLAKTGGVLDKAKALHAGAKGFLTVDEGTLGARKFFESLSKKLEDAGHNPEKIIDDLRMEIAGITDPAKAKSVLEDFERKWGILPDKISESQLYSLIEHQVTTHAKNIDKNYLTQAAEHNTAVEKSMREAADAEAAAKAKLSGQEGNIRSASDKAFDEGQAARERINTERQIREKKYAEGHTIDVPNLPKAVSRPEPKIHEPPAPRPDAVKVKGVSEATQKHAHATGRPKPIDPYSGRPVGPEPHRASVPHPNVDEQVRVVHSDIPEPHRFDTVESDVDTTTLTEEQYFAYEKQRLNSVLTGKASRSDKAEARARIQDIKRAEEAIKRQKSNGRYIPWEARLAHEKRVTKKYGSEAEKLFSPKWLSPYVQSVEDMAVEQARTYWALLGTASKNDIVSRLHVRVGQANLDYLPKDVWDKLEPRVSNAINEARGIKNNLLTPSRKRGKQVEAESAFGRLTDDDPIVIRAKKKALDDFFKETGIRVSMDAYDEARKVLRRGHVQNLTAGYLLNKAKLRASRLGESLHDAFLAERDIATKAEARRQLGALAYREMYGFSEDSIMEEFTRRYVDDGTIRHFTPELTTFQRKTLEEHFSAISGVKQGDNPGPFLQSANRPPLESRSATREYLKDIGAWSPRTHEQFVQGARTWNIDEEADYWYTRYGQIPEWADRDLLEGEKNVIFDDEHLYFAQQKSWGIFSRSTDLKLRTEGVSAAERQRINLHGDAVLEIPSRRELDLQRKYVIERYGSLVTDDGETLKKMPWLMHDDEYTKYLSTQTAESLPEGYIKTPEDLSEVMGLIHQVMGPEFERVMASKADDVPLSYHDAFDISSRIQATLLANPKWAKRHRDLIGSGLNRWAWFNRWLVFSNPAFFVTNAIDAPLKTMYYRATRRGLFNPGHDGAAAEDIARAMSLTPEAMGQDATTAMYRIKQENPVERFKNPHGYTDMEKTIDRVTAAVDYTGWVLPDKAGKIELYMRMRLAQGMYPQVYRMALKELKDPELADVAARAFIKKEALRMWPTAGHGPIESLWNKLVPFASYSVRNRVMFLSELVAHPAVINYVNFIGRYIEEQNRKDWEKRYPGTDMPNQWARRIQLPWAVGTYLDLSTFSDAARGFKPFFTAMGPQTAEDIASQWFRLVNAGPQAGGYALLNALNIGQKTEWVQVYKDGYPTGQWERVTTGLTEPWSDREADFGSMFWFNETKRDVEAALPGGLDAGEASQLFGQIFLFNGIDSVDKGQVLQSTYFAIKATDEDAAKKFLLTKSGQDLQDYWTAHAGDPQEVVDSLKNLTKAPDPRKWFHDQSAAFQQKVKSARNLIAEIRDAYARKLSQLDPSSREFRDLKAQMYLAINQVYAANPELLQSEVLSKTPSEWSRQLADWQQDKLMDAFMQMTKQRPRRDAYKTTAAYTAAVDSWEHQKQVFLQQYPQVAQKLEAGRTSVSKLQDDVHKQWDIVLSRVAARNDQIAQAKEILAEFGRDSVRGRNAQRDIDIAYFENQLDYNLLERDYATTYYTPSDFESTGGMFGPAKLRDNVVKHATVLFDFDRTSYEKALREGHLDDFLAKRKYGRSMAAAISFAKHGDPFGKFDPVRFARYMDAHPNIRSDYFVAHPGSEQKFSKSAVYVEGIRSLWKQAGNDPAKWVRLLKQHPALLAEFFKRNPGKQAEWAHMDSYIRHISVWGKLVSSGKFDEANNVWDHLPQWVRDQYKKNHPGQGQRSQQTSQYLGFMKKWVSLFDSGDKKKAMSYFNSLPDWAKNRYYAKHPDKRAEFSLTNKMSVKLADYFSADNENRAAYLAANPDLQRWLAANVSGKEGERMAVLLAYRNIPKEEAWLRSVFRDKYPQFFSKEAAGERKLKSVFDSLSKHPDMLPEFQKWVDAIWASYAENLKHPPRPASANVKLERNIPARAFKRSLSATEANRLARRHAGSIRQIA